MNRREVLITVQNKDDMEHVKAAYSNMGFSDITELLDIVKYPGLARAGIAIELSKQMPIETHLRSFAAIPKHDDETDDQWKQRVMVHPILSIVTCGYEQVVSITPEEALVYKDYAEKVRYPDSY